MKAPTSLKRQRTTPPTTRRNVPEDQNSPLSPSICRITLEYFDPYAG